MESQKKSYLQKCLAQSVSDVFSTMVGVELCPIEKAPESKRYKSEITGVMMILSTHNALLSIALSKENAALIVSFMTGIDSAEIEDEELYDGVAELVNMIAGRAKALLAGTDYHYQITPPLTVVGENHFILYKKNVSQLTMEFEAGDIKLHLDLTYL
ncbi:chemotaxis protein CheX [Pelosinus propionicus]|uniref:Chemotaxis protein CheX n=1 Tax=Pelosinus propionicus DSM 13327 TaxID=1123291 RepID=A0A1I4MU77_9FIRM|nr:chemotaxis protein CheX [Pelosinus propionicus]SFM06543.1 chemotaxis protein CheX [Pelosinus propionicus DSM 13327]